LTKISSRLLRWYDQHGRKNLPWQQNKNPYRVWVSEIMLQQTQVKTVIPYYEKFIHRFPTLDSLASAESDEVLSYWSGLGYYARARNLHKLSKIVQKEYDGCFPTDFETLLSLPGIGRSTAGAILSLALGQHHVILDGNVKRVLSRLHCISGWPGEKKVADELWEKATFHTPKNRVEDYNQAIMDLGSSVCVRGKTPLCKSCPLAKTCSAFLSNEAANYPQSKTKPKLPVKKTLMLLVCHSQSVFLEKRPPVGIWGGLWSFPELEDESLINSWCQKHIPNPVKNTKTLRGFRHTFSHFHLDITPIFIETVGVRNVLMEENSTIWYKLADEKKLGFSAPVSKLLKLVESELRSMK